MTFLLSRGSRGILLVGQTGVSPAVYSLAGNTPARRTAKMAVLLLS
jgi:hypothetical protein